MKYLFLAACLSAMIIINTASSAQAEFTVKIAAVVNGEVITQTDVDEILAPIYMQYKNTYKGAALEKKMATARTDILNQLIEDKLILQQAKKEAVTVDDKDVDRRVEDLKKNFPSQEEFEAILKNQDMSLADLKLRYREQLMIKQLVDREVFSKIAISPGEIATFYDEHTKEFMEPEQIQLRNILLKSSDEIDGEIRKRIEEIHEQLKKGTPFLEMVERYSEDQNVVNAGDMGFLKKGAVRKEIEDAVFSLDVGKISNPVKTPAGYHIFKVEAKKPAFVKALDEVQEQIRSILYEAKARTEMEKWVDKLKENAFIEVKTDERKEKS